MQRATADPTYHSVITGTAPSGWELEVSKEFMTATSPVVGQGGVVQYFEDSLSSTYDSDGGKFSFAVNPSTRPVVAGRDGREPTGPTQEGTTLTNPAGVPATNPQLSFGGPRESTTFVVEDGFDNAYADLRFDWETAGPDWDFYVRNSAGEVVASAATGDRPEVISLRDPVPGTYELVAFNYSGGGEGGRDWTGTLDFRGPSPRVVNEPEPWLLTCTDRRGTVKSVKEVFVERGESVDVGNACSPRSPVRSPRG